MKDYLLYIGSGSFACIVLHGTYARDKDTVHQFLNGVVRGACGAQVILSVSCVTPCSPWIHLESGQVWTSRGTMWNSEHSSGRLV